MPAGVEDLIGHPGQRLQGVRLPEPTGPQRAVAYRTLTALAAAAPDLAAITKSELRCGDWVIVTTRNSVYSLHVNGDGTYSVAGGWFDRNRSAPSRVRVNGCTFGGRAIKADIVAAPGLFMEFGNLVCTTRIRAPRLLRGEAPLRH